MMMEFYFGVSYPFKISHIEYFVLTGQKIVWLPQNSQINWFLSFASYSNTV